MSVQRRIGARVASAAAVVAVGLLAGCTASGHGAAARSTPGRRSPLAIEMIAGAQDSSFYLSMECGAAQEARKRGVSLAVTAPARFTADEQKPLVEGVLVGDPDALIIAPADPTALDQALDLTQENETKIVLVDSTVTDKSIGAARITSDNAAGGRLAADQLGRLLGGTGSVAVLSAPAAGPAATARIQAFQAELAAHDPALRLLPVLNDPTDSTSAAQGLVAAQITAHPDLGAVLALTENTTQGATAAIAQAHRTGMIKLATFDAGPVQMTGLASGDLTLTVAQEPAAEGAAAVDQAISAVTGTKVDAQVQTPMIAITAQTMHDDSVKPYIYDGTCTSALRGYMNGGG